MSPFFQVQLRTTDVDGARRFYRVVLGERALRMVPLHEQSIARGARPHWLGYVRVGDVDLAASSFLAHGGTLLARWTSPEGLEAAVVRDAGGAVVALAKPGSDPSAGDGVVWHLLHTASVEGAKRDYGAFGWAFAPEETLSGLGVFHPFSASSGGPLVGALSELRPGVHPHWLFFWEVPDLDRAIEAVRAEGGSVLGPTTLPVGGRVAVCDDPQGAALGLREPR